MQQPQPAPGPAAQPQQSQQPQQFQQPASHTQQWAPVIEAHDLVMDYTASMARAQAGHGVTGVIPAGTGAGYASANPAAAGPGAIQAGQPSQPAQPGFAMPTMHTLALNHVNFTLREGETVAVMGPSGSGKSTLLHALAGIIKPTAGTVIFRGADLSRMSDAERTKLRRNDFGFVFQSGQLLPELPAVENIALPMMLDGMPYRTATDTAILWLERMGLRALATHRPGEVSSASPSPVHSPSNLPWSSPTSRPARSTKPPAARSWAFSWPPRGTTVPPWSSSPTTPTSLRSAAVP